MVCRRRNTLMKYIIGLSLGLLIALIVLLPPLGYALIAHPVTALTVILKGLGVLLIVCAAALLLYLAGNAILSRRKAGKHPLRRP